MVHTTELELDVVNAPFDPTVLLELPFGDATLDDLEFGWFTPPDSPRLESPDIFVGGDGLPSDFTDLLSKNLEKQPSFNWESILHGVPESAKKQTPANLHHTAQTHSLQAQPVKMATTVMWNGLEEKKDDFAATATAISSWTPPPSPPLEDDIDFQAFVKAEFSADSIILVDGLNGSSAATKRKQAEDALALQTKRAKLQIQRPKTMQSLQSDTPESKRHTHNVLERKRREDLKYSYQSLRMQVPDLSNAERAPTGQILNKAANFIAQLKAQEDEYLQQLAVIRAENQRLRASIAQMADEQEQSE